MKPMDIEANDLLLFARVAEAGSFSRAAERSSLPKSTVSRRIAALESALGERLLQRTTRKLKLTEFGEGVLEHAQHVALDVEAAASLAGARQVEPSGRLRVSMPSDFANLLLGTMLADFVAKHPAIRLELDLSARRVDLIGESFDLALRMGELADDASLAARRIVVFSHGLYAAPIYLKRRGMPAEPEDLPRHDALLLLTRSGSAEPWRLTSDAGKQWEGQPSARATANAPELLLRLARAGAGIAAIGDHFAEPHVRAGELVPVLPEWQLPPATAWAVFPGRRLMPARTRVFIDALAAQFDAAKCRQVEAAVRRAKLPKRAAGEPLRL
jgi:DNA-binding transcriptional LysR family regulator